MFGARRLASVRLSGWSVLIALVPRESETTLRPGTKGRAFRGATLIRRCRTCVTDSPRLEAADSIGAARYRWRSAPEPTDACGVPLRVRSGGSRVHSPSSPSRLAPTAGSLVRRATDTRPVHSPLFVMWRGVWAGCFAASSAPQGRHCRHHVFAITNPCGASAEPGYRGLACRVPAHEWPIVGSRSKPGRSAATTTGIANVPIRRHRGARRSSWRRGWDSNPRSLATLRFSRAPPSTARPPLRRRG